MKRYDTSIDHIAKLYNLAFDITSGPPVFELPVITEVSEKPSDKPTHKIGQLKSQELCDERSESPTLGRQRTRQVMPRVRTTTSARTVSTNSLGAMAGAPASATTVVTCGNGKPDKVGLSNAENTGTSRIDGTKPNDREQEIALSVDKITSSDRLDGESMAPCPSIPEHNLGGLETPKPKVALVGMLDKPRSSTFARPFGSEFRAPGMNRVDSMAHRERNPRELSEELLSYFPLREMISKNRMICRASLDCVRSLAEILVSLCGMKITHYNQRYENCDRRRKGSYLQ